MQELTEFVNRSAPPKYDLIKVALAHHRFAWIHPFCNDRERYYQTLAVADTGGDTAREAWCLSVLQGILEGLRKADRLAGYAYLRKTILSPALAWSRECGLISSEEHAILRHVMMLKTAKSAGLAAAMPGLGDARRSHQLRKLVERKMLQPIHEGARQYVLSFTNNSLLRGVVRSLSAEGFVPPALNQGSA